MSCRTQRALYSAVGLVSSMTVYKLYNFSMRTWDYFKTESKLNWLSLLASLYPIYCTTNVLITKFVITHCFFFSSHVFMCFVCQPKRDGPPWSPVGPLYVKILLPWSYNIHSSICWQSNIHDFCRQACIKLNYSDLDLFL